MPFALFLCGPRVTALAEAAPAIVEELAGRGLASQVLSTAAVDAEGVLALRAEALPAQLDKLQAMGAAAVVLLTEPGAAARELLYAAAAEPVVVDWCRADDAGFEPSEAAHCQVHNEDQVIEGMAEVFAVLEGLGYVPFAHQGHLSPEQDAELVEKLKELGYV